MTTNQALVKRDQSNGNGVAVSAPAAPKPSTQVSPLTEELVDEILKGRDLHGWLRAARVARVLGLFSLYLFLDTYDIRADFNDRAVARQRDVARGLGRKARFKAWTTTQLHVAFDRLVRALRYL